jgi:hypothetical protein
MSFLMSRNKQNKQNKDGVQTNAELRRNSKVIKLQKKKYALIVG